jgi:hypothetical protein
MNIQEFIDNLKRDKARGDLAPHQVILLISLYKTYKQNDSNFIDITQLIETFTKVWKENQNLFKSKNNNPGMPIKVFVNKGYLEITIRENIVDFRNKTELKSKISSIKISSLLLNILSRREIYQYLKTRINR